MKSRPSFACLSALTLALAGFACLASPVSATAAAPSAAASASDAERALRSAANGPVTISGSTGGSAHFVGTTAGAPARRPAGLAAGASPETVARAHLARYGALFGVTDQAGQLRTERVRPAANGQQIVRFAQVVGGLPVLGGELSVSLDKAGNLLSVNGETSRSASPTSFATPAAAAAEIAIGSTAKAHDVPAAHLSASTPQRMMYDPTLVGPGKRAGARSAWQIEVRSTDGAAIRQLVVVDGATGTVGLSFNQIAYARERHVCDFNNVPKAAADNTCLPPPYVRNEGGAASAVTDVNLAYNYSGDTYDFYNTQFGRDSIDGAGLPIISAVRYCPDATTPDCPYDNAFWDGAQMTYGENFAGADDVVAHELTHGVTQYTSNLLYYYESGAINESLSDVFGELVDQSNGAGTDTAAVKWQLGEDLPASVGVVRDMKNPPALGQPDKTTSANWDSYYGDSGGVHQNSGVNNKAAYLMTDGATFNGVTVTGLGLTKVAAVYYEAENLLTSGADYRDLYNVLQQSCTNLVGTKGISVADCTQVTNAVNATEMNVYPPNDAPLPAPPPTCAGTASTLFSDNFNGTLANWTQSPAGSWAVDGSYKPNASAGTALFGSDNEDNDDFSIAMTQQFVVPSAKATYFRFDHADSFDWFGSDFGEPPEFFDGGFVEVSTNNGATWSQLGVAGNGYSGTLDPPLSRAAFGGDSTDWITSQATLSAFAGQSVKLRFHILSDGVAAASSALGWWIDNAKLYSCAPPPRADFSGDGKADNAVWRSSNHTWYVKGLPAVNFGASTDKPVSADYTGDGKADVAVRRPSNNTWYVKDMSPVPFGAAGDLAAPADYTGDGRADIAVFRPSNGTWYVKGQSAVPFGASGDIPVPGDFTGDGKADFAVFRPSNGTWYVRGGGSSVAFGRSGDRPTAVDFNGDGRADKSVWRPSNGTWYLSSGATAFGASTDVPVAGDFTGDGQADIAVWRPSTGTWYVRNGTPAATVFGGSGDVPLSG